MKKIRISFTYIWNQICKTVIFYSFYKVFSFLFLLLYLKQSKILIIIFSFRGNTTDLATNIGNNLEKR